MAAFSVTVHVDLGDEAAAALRLLGERGAVRMRGRLWWCDREPEPARAMSEAERIGFEELLPHGAVAAREGGWYTLTAFGRAMLEALEG